MSTFALISGGTVVQLASSQFPVNDALSWVDVTSTSPAPGVGWGASEAAGVWTFAAPPDAPAPTLAQLAASAINAGVTITSTATPALNGVYGCDAMTQSNLNSVFNLIQRTGGASFPPPGATTLIWPIAGGTVTFTTVADFLNMATAIGYYVLALISIQVTGTGTLPAPTITIP